VSSGVPWGGFSIPGESVRSIVDSEEEMFSEMGESHQAAAAKQEKDAVKL
jgi:hypothetical protein